jgi:hypothetical protein
VTLGDLHLAYVYILVTVWFLGPPSINHLSLVLVQKLSIVSLLTRLLSVVGVANFSGSSTDLSTKLLSRLAMILRWTNFVAMNFATFMHRTILR